MKFTDGFWHLRPGVTANYAQEAHAITPTTTPDGDGIVVHAPSKVIEKRGDMLNRPLLTVTLSSPLEGVVRVRIERHQGAHKSPGFALNTSPGTASVIADDAGAELVTGNLTARISKGAPWDLSFERDGQRLTGSGHKSVGHMTLSADAPITAEPAGV